MALGPKLVLLVECDFSLTAIVVMLPRALSSMHLLLQIGLRNEMKIKTKTICVKHKNESINESSTNSMVENEAKLTYKARRYCC